MLKQSILRENVIQNLREFDHATYEGSDREMSGREIDNLEETLTGRKYVG